MTEIINQNKVKMKKKKIYRKPNNLRWTKHL